MTEFEGGITSGFPGVQDGPPPVIPTVNDKYVLVLFRRTQKFPEVPATAPEIVSVVKEDVVML